MFWIRQHAGFMFAEDPIAIARHHFVDCVSKPSWQHEADSRQTPNAPELPQHIKDCIRPRQQSFIGSLVVLDYIDGVEVVRVYAVSRHQVVRKFGL